MAINLGVAEGYIELDFSALKQACAGAVKELEKIDREGALAQSELQKLEAASTGVKGAFQEAANASKKLSAEIDSAKRRVDTYQKGIQELNSHISQSKQKQEQLRQEIEKTAAQYDRSQKKVERMAELHGKESEEYQKAAEKAQEHRNKLNQLENQYEMLGRGIEESENRIVDFKMQINNTEAEISDLTRELNDAQNKARIFGSAAKEAGEKWQAAGQKISGVGNALTMGVTTPLLAAGTASVKMALDAESSFAKVSTIADQTVLSYDRMKTGVVEASNQSGIAIVDFNEALYQAISAGVDSGNAIAFTTNMVKLAKGGFTETSKAVDVVTTALNAYGLEASEASAVSDKLIVTQNLGKTTVDELAASLGRVIPTAKNVNVDFDNVSAAMATLTKNGIATAEATTYYNSMLNELGKSGTAADKALRQLTKKGFAELITSGSSMTDILTLLQDHAKKSGKSLSDMFGSAEASKAALTIMKNDGKEYNQILKEMQKSAGATEKAYKKMNDTDLEKFKREINKLKNAGIQAGGKLLPIVTKGVEGIGKLADSFSKLSPEQQEAILKTAGFAAAVGPVVKVVGTLTSGVGTVTKGFVKLIDKLGSTSKIDKGAKALGGVSSVISGINPIAGVAAVGIVGIGTALYKASKDAERADLERRFGDIKLSAEEIEEVAKRLTSNDWTIKIDAVVDANEKLIELEQNIESTLYEINKTEWKVSVGLELTEEEKSNYQANIESYISETQAYIEQKHYTASLAIETMLTPGTSAYENLSTFVSEFYANTESEMKRLGDELAEATNKALSDGIIDEDELKNIEEARKRLQEYVDQLADAEYSASLTRLNVTVPKDGLTVDSFKDLQKEIREQLQTRLNSADETFDLIIQSLNLEYPNGGADYDKLLQEATLQYNSQRGGVIVDALDIEVETINSNFSDQIETFRTDTSNDLQRAFDNAPKDVNAENFWSNVNVEFRKAYQYNSTDVSNSCKEFIEEMTPDAEQLEQVAQVYYDLGMAPPENISNALESTRTFDMMNGGFDHMFDYMAQQISESPALQEAITAAGSKAGDIPEELAEALRINYGLIYDSATGIWTQIQQSSEDATPTITQSMRFCGVTASQSLIDSIKGQEESVQAQTVSLLQQLSQGESLKHDEIMTLFANLGFETSDQLIDSLESQKPEVQAQAVDLLVQMQNASDAEKPGLLMQFQNLGIEVDDSLKNGIISNLQVVKDGTGDMAYTLKTSSGEEIKNITPEFKKFLKQMGVEGVDKLEETVSNTKIDYPDMERADWSGVAKAGLAGMQAYVKQHPLSVTANIFAAGASALRGYASGGIIEQPEFALVGEAGPESIIPLSAGKRSRALSLWEETGKRLGVPDMDLRAATLSAVSSSSRISQQFTEKMQLEIPVTPVIDYQRLAKTLREQFQKNPIVLEPDIRVTTNPTFVVGSKEIAVTIAPEVDAQLGQINKQRMRGM